MIHLYAGPDDSTTFKRTAKEMGMDDRQVIEIDVLRGPQWDMCGEDLYAELMHLACEGQIAAVLGGPNCRTRSKLRHLERDGLPGPSRTWNGGEWGHEKLSPLEKAKCHQDDVMLLRMVMLFVVAEEVRKASQKQAPVAFLLEHPAAPMDVPEAVSWWRTEQWQALRKVYGLGEVDLDQGEWGGHAVKPTTLGTNVEIKMTFKGGAQGDRRTKVAKRWLLTNEELVQGSKRLARWAPRHDSDGDRRRHHEEDRPDSYT